MEQHSNQWLLLEGIRYEVPMGGGFKSCAVGPSCIRKSTREWLASKRDLEETSRKEEAGHLKAFSEGVSKEPCPGPRGLGEARSNGCWDLSHLGHWWC